MNFAAGCPCMPIPGGGSLELESDAEAGGRACRVIAYRVGTIVQRFWIARDDATPVRFTLESHFENKGKTFTTSAESVLKRLDTATKPDPSMFRFTPPADAKQASMGEE